MVRQSKVRKGVRLTKGHGYDIKATKGRARRFKGTCLGTINIGGKRVALFSIPKR